MRFRLSGIDDLQDEFEQREKQYDAAERGTKEAIANAVEYTTERVFRKAVDKAPEEDGELIASGDFETYRSQLKGRVFFTAPHARSTEFGSRPHLITPKTPGGVLRFKYDGEVIFTTEVDHPGTPEQPFLYNRAGSETPALEEEEGEFGQRLYDAAEDVLEDVF